MTEGGEQLLLSCSSPDLIEAAGIVVTVQDVNGAHKTIESEAARDKESSVTDAGAAPAQSNSDSTS